MQLELTRALGEYIVKMCRQRIRANECRTGMETNEYEREIMRRVESMLEAKAGPRSTELMIGGAGSRPHEEGRKEPLCDRCENLGYIASWNTADGYVNTPCACEAGDRFRKEQETGNEN